MKIHEVKIYQEFDAPAETMFETFSDHTKLGKIMGLPMERIVDSPTPGNPNGVGSVRLIKAGLFSFEETVRKAENPTLLEYKITRGTPLNHHYGIMKLSNLPEGRSALNYTITVGSNVPFLGAIVKNVLQSSIAKGMASYARKLKKG